MNLYRLNDSYYDNEPLKNHTQILEEINDVLITSNIDEIQYFTSKGIIELINNYLIVLTEDNENKMRYEMTIRRMDHEFIDFNYFHQLYRQYHLKINIETSSIEVLSSFDPTFFPSPASPMPKPIIKK